MVGRVSALLAAFRPDDAGLGVSELARRTELPKATVHRITNDLVDHGFLERTPSGLRLGLRLFELGETATRPRDLRRLALASMTDLRSTTNLTVHLAVLERTEVVYIEILKARNMPRLPSRVGGRMPAHATGVGKALLAASPKRVIQEVVDQGLAKVGPLTICDPAEFRRELARVRAAGTAYEREESGPGVSCAAAAITAGDGTPIAALSVAGWTGQFEPKVSGPAVRMAALSLSRMLSRNARLSA